MRVAGSLAWKIPECFFVQSELPGKVFSLYNLHRRGDFTGTQEKGKDGLFQDALPPVK
jgi:hypothetical protein